MEHARKLGPKEHDNQDLMKVLSGTTCNIFMVDRDLRIIYASPEALR